MAQTQLATAELGSTGLQITRVGFGAWALGGGDWEFGWGDQDDAESIATIEHALELGINWIDTAAGYGFGHSEQVVGRAIRGLSTQPHIFTKCGLLEGPGRRALRSLERDSIRREAEASLTRLGVEAIDLYQIHWPRPPEAIEEGWSALVELRDEGLVRHIGVSNFSVAQLQLIGAIAPVQTLQPPYSLIARDVEAEILPYAEQHDIGVIAYSPMGSGMLTGAMTRDRIEAMPDNDWRKNSDAFREPRLSENLAAAGRVAALAERLGVSAGAVAIAWVLRNPAVDGAIVGLRRPDQADELIVGAALELSDADAAALAGS